MAEPAVLVIDQGTSATKAFLFDKNLNQVYSEKTRHRIHRPRPGWAEADAAAILNACQALTGSLLKECESQSFSPVGLGMAFQRSTFLFWDRKSRHPLTTAASWQDTRAKVLTGEFAGHQDWIQRTTGIPLSPHFGGPKFLFSVRNDPDLKGRVESGEALFGPISSFVTHGLTGSQVIDESIAGRSLLLNLESTAWDPDLLDLFEVPESCLPRLVPTCQHVGDVVMGEQSIPVWCVIGDQQASLVGQERWGEGDVAMNLGTSGSVLVNSGRHPTVVPSLLSNVLYSFPRERHFLIEGTINGVGSLFRWLEDYLNLPHEEMNWEKRCVQATDGILVPGISGLAAPYWTGEFDTAFMGFAHPEDPDRIVRAAMESVGFLVKDICEVLGNVTAREPKEIVASGGFSKPVLLQFIADLLNVPVWSSKGSDMTALGVARLVAQQTLGIPLNRSTGIRDRQIVPTMSSDQRVAEISRWRGALRVLRIINSRSGGKEANT